MEDPVAPLLPDGFEAIVAEEAVAGLEDVEVELSDKSCRL